MSYNFIINLPIYVLRIEWAGVSVIYQEATHAWLESHPLTEPAFLSNISLNQPWLITTRPQRWVPVIHPPG